MVATAQIKFASEARSSQYIVPFVNTEPTYMLLSGHFMDIEGRVLVYQIERYQLNLTCNASWYGTWEGTCEFYFLTCEFYFLTCFDDLICCSNDLISCLHNLSSCSNNIINLLQQLNISSEQLNISFAQLIILFAQHN